MDWKPLKEFASEVWGQATRKVPSWVPSIEEYGKSLSPQDKLRMVKAMGFRPVGAVHTYDCPANGAAGRCQCAGEPTSWGQPPEVDEITGQTWEQRVEARRLAFAHGKGKGEGQRWGGR